MQIKKICSIVFSTMLLSSCNLISSNSHSETSSSQTSSLNQNFSSLKVGSSSTKTIMSSQIYSSSKGLSSMISSSAGTAFDNEVKVTLGASASTFGSFLDFDNQKSYMYVEAKANPVLIDLVFNADANHAYLRSASIVNGFSSYTDILKFTTEDYDTIKTVEALEAKAMGASYSDFMDSVDVHLGDVFAIGTDSSVGMIKITTLKTGVDGSITLGIVKK